MSSPPPSPPPPSPPLLVLYDGLCGFCDASVQWLLDHDRDRRLRYAPLQGETARAILARHPEIPPDLDSIILVEPIPGEPLDGRTERLRWHSDAIARIAAELPAPWRLGAWMRLIPRPVRDLGYRFVARIRYRIWGRKESCRIPSPQERALFLT